MLRILVAIICLAPAIRAEVLLISHKAISSLGFYTPEGKLVAKAPVGPHPHEFVLSNDGRYAYTTDNGTMKIEEAGTGGNTVSIVDLKERKKIGEISLGEFRRPHGIDIDRKTGRLLVTTELPDKLLLIDPEKREVVRRYDTKGRTSHMVTLGPGARWAYVSNSNSAAVSAVNLATGEVKIIPTGERPEGSVLSKDGREVYVANREGASVSVIDTAKQAAVVTIAAGKGPVRIAITPDGSRLVWAAMHDKAVEIADRAARKVIGRVPVGGNPVSLSLSPDGKLAFASAEEIDTVYVISLPERKVAREIKVEAGAHPDPVALFALR